MSTTELLASRAFAPADQRYLPHLDYIKCFAIVSVVVIHVSAAGCYLWSSEPAASWWISTGFNTFSRSCVPLFLMASGATLLESAKVEPVATFLSRRVRRIGLPLVVWSLVYLADRKWLIGETLTARTVLRYITTGTTFYHLPFFYYLTGLYLSAPVLARFAETARGSTVFYFLALWATVVSAQLASDLTAVPLGMAIPAVAGFAGYFVAGRLLRDMAIDGRIILVCLALALAGWLATLLGTFRLTLSAGQLNELFLEYNRPNVVLLSVATYLLMSSAPVRRFAREHPDISQTARRGAVLSFGIFLIHPLILQTVVPKLHLSWNTGGPFIGILLTTFVTIIVSGAVVWAIRKCPGGTTAVG